MKLVRTRLADADIEAIADYIALDNPNAALSWVDDVEAKLAFISQTPGAGVQRPDVMAGLRTTALGNYVICYRLMASGVEILRVFHGARQWQVLL